MRKDRRIGVYIEKARPFAHPILKHLRKIIHQACPRMEETIKWSFPHFQYLGTVCAMAAFKNHCSFGFWKWSLMKDPHGIFGEGERAGMGNFGKITSLRDLPPDNIIIEYIREAVWLNEQGIRPPVRERDRNVEKKLEIPPYLMKALNKNAKALKVFEDFSYTNKKEYVEWVTDAKTERARNLRLKKSVAWMAQGKTRNWKYIRKKYGKKGIKEEMAVV